MVARRRVLGPEAGWLECWRWEMVCGALAQSLLRWRPCLRRWFVHEHEHECGGRGCGEGTIELFYRKWGTLVWHFIVL